MQTSEPRPSKSPQKGFILAITILLVLGVSAISVGTMYTSKMGRMSAGNYSKKTQAFMASDGMATLLSQEIINGNGGKYVDASRTGEIDGEVWTGIGGNDVDAFIITTIKDPIPDQKVTSNHLGSNVDFDNYGVKWTGWIIPPLSGDYTFYTRSDDESKFFLSTDETKGNLRKDPSCWLDNWVYEWPSSGTGVSKPIALIGGNRYYFEYYHKEGVGVDVGQMGWDGPEYFSERPISGRYLSRYQSDPPWAGTVNVGNIPVRYQVASAGLDRYRISTESIITKAKSPKDTVYRTPLSRSVSLKGQPVAPPNKLWLRVIHYDYASDGTANEFNTNVNLGVFTGMVKRTLTNYTKKDADFFGMDSIAKPVRDTIRPNRNCGLNKWFQEWTFDNLMPSYAAGPGSCAMVIDPSGDNWRNRKYYDSLEFTLDASQGPSTFVYSRMGDYNTFDPSTSYRKEPEYFPAILEKQGQDPVNAITNPNKHNFGFCTELHTTFIYQSGLKFEFTGDDDVWVFVNRKLVIDLGGIHAARSAFLQLDDLKGMNFGQVYDFDFFQCERQVEHSSSRIVTNIKMVPPKGKPVVQWRRDFSAAD